MIMADASGPWFPTIFSDKCDGCIKAGKPRCVEFCPNGVFEFKDGKAIVAYPVKCGGPCSTVHCSACAPICHKKAIVFPSRNTSCREKKEEEKGMIRKITCRVCGKQYWTNREANICFDCENK
jgi:NAD-dependent dihydropyrimidine dehydrogenase PreA subunit